MKGLIRVLLVFISPALLAQSWPFISGVGIWGLQSRAHSAVEVTGGFLINGLTGVIASGTDVTVMKLEPSGDTLWIKHYGGNAYDAGRCIVTSPDGYFSVAGSTSSFGEGSDDVLLIKIDVNGDTLFTRCYGGPLRDAAWSMRAIQYGSPGYILCGYTESYGAGMKDIYMVRTDLNGSLLWTKTFGGVKNEEAYDIVETHDKGFALTGYTESLGADSSDLFILKTDSSGNFEWMKRFGNNYDDYGRGIYQAGDSALIVAGYGKTGSLFEDAWLIKHTVDGNNMIWGKSYGGNQFDSFYDVIPVSDGGILAGGYTNGFGAGGQDVFIIHTDANGDSLWSRTFGGPGCEEVYGMLETADSGFILASYEQSFTQSGQLSWIIKTDRNGYGPGCHEYGAAPVVLPLNVLENIAGPFATSNNGVEGRTKFGISRGDHIDRYCSPGGISEDPVHPIQVFPNPVHEYCSIVFPFPLPNDVTIEISDIRGSLVKTFTAGKGHTMFELSLREFQSGIYMIAMPGFPVLGPVRIAIVK